MTFVTKGSGHIHKFTKPKTQKVLLSSGKSLGKMDVLKQLACETKDCTASITYDLERFNV